jgi:hypothetical protein
MPLRRRPLVLLCLVRDSLPWIEAFVERDLALGVKHTVFLDNNSNDGTAPAAERYDDVTVLLTDEIECLAEGISEALFKTVPRLTRFPLVFSDGRIKPLEVKPLEGSPHHVDNARIADFSCVLFHYKFLEHLREKAAQALREENHWGKSARYKRYLEVLERNPSLQVRQETSKENTSVNDLLEEGFLVVSDDYVRWVDAEEERSVFSGAERRATRVGRDLSEDQATG